MKSKREKYFFLFFFVILIFSACTTEESSVTKPTVSSEDIKNFQESLEMITKHVCSEAMTDIIDSGFDQAVTICKAELKQMIIAIDGWPGFECHSGVHSCDRDDANHTAFQIVYTISEHNNLSGGVPITYADGLEIPIRVRNYTGMPSESYIAEVLAMWAGIWEENTK
ncbi:hypothetical protein ACFLZ4_01380 [Patescibacteria group bacterium]